MLKANILHKQSPLKTPNKNTGKSDSAGTYAMTKLEFIPGIQVGSTF